MLRLFQTQAWCIITHPTSSLSAPPLYVSSRAARQISLHQDLLCVFAAESEGRGACVSSLTGPFFAAEGYFSSCSGGFCCCCCVVRKLATCPTLTALRSLQLYAGGRACGRRRGVGARQFDSFALCFSWKHSLLAVSHAVS